MQSFLIVHQKREAAGRLSGNELLQDLESLVTQLSPMAEDDADVVSSTRRTQSGFLCYLTNEPGDMNLSRMRQDGPSRLMIGNSDEEPEKFFESSAARQIPKFDVISNASGCFGVLGERPDGFHYIADSVGSFPAYVCETRDFFVVSSRMTITYAAAKELEGFRWDRGIDYDVPAIRNFASCGHFSFRSSAFVNVWCTRAGEILTVRGDRADTQARDVLSAFEGAMSKPEYSSLVTSIADSVVKACRPMAASERVKITLTGGRDSRLVAAAMNHFDTEVIASTAGLPEHPDVSIAAMIAEEMGWQHLVTAPSSRPNLIEVEDPLSRLDRVLDVFGLETSAWDDVEPYGAFLPNLLISGVGGELLRGGYSATQWKRPTVGTVESTINAIVAGPKYLKRLPNSRDDNAFDVFRIGAQISPLETMDRLYLENRNARWVAARRRGQRFRRDTFDPLFDNRLVSLVRKTDIETRWSEILVFDVIAKLAPGLRDMPTEGSPWRFERSDFEGMKRSIQGGVIGAQRQVANAQPSPLADFRKLKNQRVRDAFLGALEECRTDAASEIVDFGLLEAEVAGELKYPTAVWHTFTALGILAGKWLEPNRRRTVIKPIEYEIDPAPNL